MGIFKNIYIHLKYNRILKKIYKKEHIIENIGALLNCKVHKDWIGRLYMILNPNTIPKDQQIFELLDSGADNRQFIEKWIMDRLIVMEKFIKANNLFDLLTYHLSKVDDYDNYLFIIEPITLYDFRQSMKKIGIILTLLIILSIILITFI